MSYLFDEIKEKVKELSKKVFATREKDYILEEVCPYLSYLEQAQLLEIFQSSMKSFVRYLNTSGENTQRNIIEQLEKGMEQYEKTGEKKLIPFFTTYLNIDNVEWKDEIVGPVLETLNKDFEQKDKKDPNILFALESFLKELVYSTVTPRIYKKLVKSKSYQNFEEILKKYIHSLTEEELLDSELIVLLVDARYALPKTFDFEILKGKVGDASFEKYKENIESLSEMKEEQKEDFKKEVKKYRIKNLHIPEEIALYVNLYFGEDWDLLRMANLDLIRHYLEKNGIQQANVIYDELISRFNAKGISAWNLIALADVNLSMILFHEATHVIQFNNQKEDRNYYGYGYSMLKDKILQEKLAPSIYNRNHNRYLFEIDADIRGKREFYRILEKLGELGEKEKEDQESLEEEENFRISLSRYLNIDGENYDKGDLFDNLIQEEPTILRKYPILNIEYKQDGTRRNVVEIFQELEFEVISGKRDSEEIKAIAECIFQEGSVIENAEETIKMLNDYIPGDTIILEMEKKIVEGLAVFLKDHNIGDLMKKK